MQRRNTQLIISVVLAASLLYTGWKSHTLLDSLGVMLADSSSFGGGHEPGMVSGSRLRNIRVRLRKRADPSDPMTVVVRQHFADPNIEAAVSSGFAELSQPVHPADVAAASRSEQDQPTSPGGKAFQAVGGRGLGQPADRQGFTAPAALPPPEHTCESWLASADRVPDARDFAREPITVLADSNDMLGSCDVPCRMSRDGAAAALGRGYDAHFGERAGPEYGPSVVRSMESVTNYAHLDTDAAHRSRTDIIMTTHLDSDVPAGYLSWSEYDIMKPPAEKQEDVAAFISNCAARSFRLPALEALSKRMTVHSFGQCLRSNQTAERKGEVLRRYRFTLAFENSQEEDYVTEKYAQALEAGSVPVVIGAPNIRDYEPVPGSMLVIDRLADVPAVAKRMQALLRNRTAYEEMLAWKRTGPQDKFLALVDLNAVHSSCRLCIHLATWVREREAAALPQPRPCRCLRAWRGATVYHLHVRERGRLAGRDIFLEGSRLTAAALHEEIVSVFEYAGHRPVWAQQRPDFAGSRTGRPQGLRLYKVYPVGTTQRDALYGAAALDSDAKVAAAVMSRPCLQLEAVFV